MGCPASGRTLFIYPIQSRSLTCAVNGTDKLHNREANHISLHTCQELHLELVPLKNRGKMNSDVISKMNASVERSHDRLGNGIVSSPKTPMYQPKLSSPSINQLGSPICEDSVSNLVNLNSSCVDSFDIKEALKDESAKKLLQTCAASWLYSRSLLCGNLVTVPMPSEHCIFLVIDGNKLPADAIYQDVTSERSHPQASGSVDHESDAFVINHETKVYFYSPFNTASKCLQKGGLPNAEIQSKDVKASAEHKKLKLGGLSKEYAILKDIIVSSSVKSTLSR